MKQAAVAGTWKSGACQRACIRHWPHGLKPRDRLQAPGSGARRQTAFAKDFPLAVSSLLSAFLAISCWSKRKLIQLCRYWPEPVQTVSALPGYSDLQLYREWTGTGDIPPTRQPVAQFRTVGCQDYCNQPGPPRCRVRTVTQAI